LRAAAKDLIKPGVSSWQLAGLLSDEIMRFRTRRWRRLQSGEVEPITELDRNLFEAFSQGLEVPSTQLRLHNIIKPIY